MKYLIALFLSCLSVVAWPVVGVTNVPYYFYVAPGANVSVVTNGTVYTISASGGNATNTMFVAAGTNTTVQTNGFTFTVNSTWPTRVAYATNANKANYINGYTTDSEQYLIFDSGDTYTINYNSLNGYFEFGQGVVQASSFEGSGASLTDLPLFRTVAGTNITVETNGLLYTVSSVDEISFTTNTLSLVTNTFNGSAQYVTHVMDTTTLVNPPGTNNGAISFRFLTSTPRALYFPTNWAWLSTENLTLNNTNYTITVSNKIGYLSLVSFTPGVSNIVAKYLQP